MPASSCLSLVTARPYPLESLKTNQAFIQINKINTVSSTKTTLLKSRTAILWLTGHAWGQESTEAAVSEPAWVNGHAVSSVMGTLL